MSKAKMLFAGLLAGSALLAGPTGSRADFVTLQNATATFSQSTGDPLSVANAIDADPVNTGWAIARPGGGDVTQAETAAFETTTDVGFAGGTLLTFTIDQLFPNGVESQLTLGRFRLSVTTDDRSLFADGLAVGGDVTANWVELAPTSAISANGATLTILGDNSVLASGFSPLTDVYTIEAVTNLTGITGVRLEALTDPSLPTGGPGRQPSAGNFVVSDFVVQATARAVPEPASVALVGIGLVGMALVARRRRK